MAGPESGLEIQFRKVELYGRKHFKGRLFLVLLAVIKKGLNEAILLNRIESKHSSGIH